MILFIKDLQKNVLTNRWKFLIECILFQDSLNGCLLLNAPLSTESLNQSSEGQRSLNTPIQVDSSTDTGNMVSTTFGKTCIVNNSDGFE